MSNSADVERRKEAEHSTRECAVQKTRRVLRENDYTANSSWQRLGGGAEQRRTGPREDKMATREIMAGGGETRRVGKGHKWRHMKHTSSDVEDGREVINELTSEDRGLEGAKV